MAQDTPRAAKPTRNWGRLALFVSLAINLLVAGVVAGALLNGPRDRDQAPVLGDLGLGPFAHALPRGDRRALTGALRDRASAFRENRAQMRVLFEAVLTALRAKPYDHAALSEVINRQQAQVVQRQALGRQLLLDRIAAMSDAERTDYADELDKSLRRGPPPRRR